MNKIYGTACLLCAEVFEGNSQEVANLKARIHITTQHKWIGDTTPARPLFPVQSSALPDVKGFQLTARDKAFLKGCGIACEG